MLPYVRPARMSSVRRLFLLAISASPRRFPRPSGTGGFAASPRHDRRWPGLPEQQHVRALYRDQHQCRAPCIFLPPTGSFTPSAGARAWCPSLGADAICAGLYRRRHRIPPSAGFVAGPIRSGAERRTKCTEDVLTPPSFPDSLAIVLVPAGDLRDRGRGRADPRPFSPQTQPSPRRAPRGHGGVPSS